MSRYLFIVNPAAGKGTGERVARRLKEALGKRNESRGDFVYTEGIGAATRMASEASADVIVAIGGDGTINEVINGIVGSEKQLGVIPAGSGNDLIKSLRIPRDPEEAITVVQTAHSRRVDAGIVRWKGVGESTEKRFFLNGAGIGFDAAVASRARTIPYLRGTLLYLTAVLLTMADYRAPRFELFADGEEFAADYQLLIAIGNGSCAGGGFLLTPEAVPDDGYLDLCAISHRSAQQIVRLIPNVLRARHTGTPGVLSRRVKSLRIRSDKTFIVHADGEVLTEGTSEASVTVQPGAINVLCPT